MEPKALRKIRRNNSSGAMLIEMSFVLPLLLLIISLMVDTGRALDHYISMVRTARDGVSKGVRVVGLTDTYIGDLDTPCTTTIEGSSITSDPSLNCSIHNSTIHSRSLVLLQLQDEDHLSSEDLPTLIKSSFNNSTRTVTVQVDSYFKPLLTGYLISIPFSATVKGEYLISSS